MSEADSLTTEGQTVDIIQSNYDVYAKYVSMFTTYKVAELREIAQRLNLIGRSTMKKGDLAHNIAVTVLRWADQAFDDHHMNSNHTLHTDVPSVIDTEEFPMDHGQFTDWYNRHGGMERFDAFKALESDHAEALDLNALRGIRKAQEFKIPGTDIVITDPASVEILTRHYRRIKAYNPSMRRNKDGKVALTPAQRRRAQKKCRSIGQRNGLFEGITV